MWVTSSSNKNVHATNSINSPRTFLLSFLVLRDLTNALLICAFVASSSTSNSASCASVADDRPKYAS